VSTARGNLEAMKNPNDQNTIFIESRTKAYSNSIYDVYIDDICDNYGNGVKGYVSVEARVTRSDLVTGVCVLPYQEDTYGLINVFRHPLGRSSYEAVKGHVELGETLVKSARRELLEESGFDCNHERLRKIGVVAPEGGLFKGRTALFLADVGDLHQTDRSIEVGHCDFTFFQASEIEQMIKAMSIEDATTVVVLLRALKNIE